MDKNIKLHTHTHTHLSGKEDLFTRVFLRKRGGNYLRIVSPGEII